MVETEKVRVILVILPRSRELVLTREEEREIEEVYVLSKHSDERQKICFSTPLAQVLSGYVEKANLNIFVSSYPQADK